MGQGQARVARWLAWALAGLLGLPALPLGAAPRSLNEYSRDVWTTRQGLPHNLVAGIAQTPEGYLWFGTWEGLARYNGLDFRTFDRGNVPVFADNGVRVLRVAADGALWMGTSRGGIYRHAGGEWTALTTRQGLGQDEIMDLVPLADGGLWVATESAGVDRYDGRGFRHFRQADGLPSDVMYCVALGVDGALWAGTTHGLARLREGGVEAFGAAQGLPPGPVFSLLAEADGSLFVGTEQGLYRREGERFVPAAADLPRDTTTRLLRGRDGALWIGTVNYGLLRWLDGRVEALGSLAGLPNNRVASLLEDREGSLWVGTNGGLLRLRDAPFATYTVEHGLSDDYVRTLFQADDGVLWVGTSRGLNRYVDGHFSVLTRADGLPGDSILSLAPARGGGVWIGTYANGLVRWNGGVKAVRDIDSGLAGNQVRAIVETRDGTLWVGTTRGLSRIENGQVRNFGVADGLPRDYVMSLHVARDGRVWAGTSNGAALITGERVQPLDLGGLDGVEDVFGFAEDPDGTVWISTDRGLVRDRGGQRRLIGRRQGLPVDAVFQAVEDRESHFWLTTNRGVLRVARAEAEAVADGQLARVQVDSFAEADGMASAQCNGVSNPAAWLSREGRVWVATAKGLAVVDPARLSGFARHAPPVIIEEISVDEHSVALRPQLELPPGTRKLELRFAGLSYLMPQKIRYRYRLEGFDSDWVERGTQRFAQFTNLGPGNYRFRVGAANPGGDWGEEEATLSFRIRPYVWQQPLFWTAAVVAALLGLLGLYRLRVRQLRASERRLRDLVDRRTQDLSEQTRRLIEANVEKGGLLSRLREQSEAFERQAREDALTGLANRRHFDERLAARFAQCLSSGEPLVLALLDIDHFKRINDGWSHAAGDAALRLVARTLQCEAGAAEVIARYGGEEFALLYVGQDLARVRASLEALREAIAACDCSDFAAGLALSVSIGISDQDGLAHPERMVSRADARLYEAKNAGRNRVCG